MAGRVSGGVRSQIRKEVQLVVREQRDVVREEGRRRRGRGAAVPDEAGVVQLGVAAGCEQRGDGVDIALPVGHAEDEEAAEDEVERGGREARVRELVGAGTGGADEFFEVALDELEVWRLGVQRWDWGQVEAVDGGGGAGGCEGVRDGASAAADVEGAGDCGREWCVDYATIH